MTSAKKLDQIEELTAILLQVHSQGAFGIRHLTMFRSSGERPRENQVKMRWKPGEHRGKPCGRTPPCNHAFFWLILDHYFPLPISQWQETLVSPPTHYFHKKNQSDVPLIYSIQTSWYGKKKRVPMGTQSWLISDTLNSNNYCNWLCRMYLFVYIYIYLKLFV